MEGAEIVKKKERAREILANFCQFRGYPEILLDIIR